MYKQIKFQIRIMFNFETKMPKEIPKVISELLINIEKCQDILKKIVAKSEEIIIMLGI